MNPLKKLSGIPVGKVLKRLLKKPVLALLRMLEEEVDENWQRSQGSGDVR